jgi:Na+-transporting NADH:ubiquinone oxidoreductase subunit F
MIVIFGVLMAVTIVLIVFDILLGGSGKEKILTINKDTKITVTDEGTALSVLSDNKIFIPSACGGKATCGLCKFRVIDNVPDVKPTEEPFLSIEQRDMDIRLSCQHKVRESKTRYQIRECFLR